MKKLINIGSAIFGIDTFHSAVCESDTSLAIFTNNKIGSLDNWGKIYISFATKEERDKCYDDLWSQLSKSFEVG